jgi:voltage-gated potassium channel Kch
MTPRPGLPARLRYWFDNTMSRGTPALVGWLAVVSALLVVVIAAALAIATSGGPPQSIFSLLWETFTGAFDLSIPGDGDAAVHILWLLLALGGIFVVSALVGLLNNGIGEKLEELRKGRSAVVERDHTVILGWSDQVFTVVSELVTANRSRRKAAIVILADQDKPAMEEMLRHRLGATGNTRVVCRTGNPLDVTDLELANLNAARSIIVLTPQSAKREDADAYVLKILLAINRGPAFRDKDHHVVTSVRDGSVRAVAQLAGGNAVVIDADDISARLIVQAARQSGLSAVYHNLLDFGGDELYVVAEPRLTGQTFGASLLAYSACCPVGLMRADGATTLNPPMETVIGSDDKIVVIAADDSAIKLSDEALPVVEDAIVRSAHESSTPERTLLLGWNGRAARIIEQLDTYVAEGSSVEVITDRDDAGHSLATLSVSLRSVVATVKDGDIRDRRVLESLDIGGYDNVIVLCDDHLDPLTADSRVLVTLLQLRDILAKRGQVGAIVSEIRDDRDRELAQLTRDDDFVISDRLVSLLMTQISENVHLESVFADLFDSAGSEIYIRDASQYVQSASNVTFATATAAARQQGEVAIGYRTADAGDGHGMVLNPDKTAAMPPIDRLIVLARA